MSTTAEAGARVGESGRGRLAGVDRGTVAPSLLVVALAVLLSVVLPSLNAAAPYRHPVRNGDVAELAGGITLVPLPDGISPRERSSATSARRSAAPHQPSS